MRDDRIRQVKTTKLKHGDDHYAKIGGKGGELSPTKFTSDSGSKAAKARWEKKRAEDELKRKESEQNDK